ncbi:hypothetical protein QAD02_006926, partial [Eretmocerus hayati]
MSRVGRAARPAAVFAVLGLLLLLASFGKVGCDLMLPSWPSSVFVENKDLNPCEDFFTYVCESQYKSPDKSTRKFKSLVAEAQDNIIGKIKVILEEDAGPNFHAIRAAKTFYASCMDTEKIDNHGIGPIQMVLRQLKGWPMTRKHSEHDHVASWQDLLIFYGKITVFPFYEISVNNDALKRNHTIMVRQPKMIVKEPLLYRAKTFYKYVDYIKTIAMTIANYSESRISEQSVNAEAKEIASFEAELSKILESRERLDFYHPMSLEKFQNLTNQFVDEVNKTLDWVKIINGMYYASSKLVSAGDVIDISTLSYFQKLIQLIQNTPYRVLVNYIHWRFVHQFLPHTSNHMRNLYFDMTNFFQEPVKNISRWKFCGFEPAFDHAISHVFAKKYLSRRIEECAQSVLSDIKQVTMRTVRKSYLLNENEKKLAEEKILNMSVSFGVMDPIRNLSLLNNYYKKLVLSDEYFTNVLILRKFHKMKEFEAFKKQTTNFTSSLNNNFMKITTISSIGSAYEFFDNRVLIKAENLMPPLFDPDFPEFKKYGMLGFILAYETMHAFNDADSIVNVDPRVHLYSEDTKLKFWNKMDCFINQFENYYIPDPFNWEKHVYVDGERSAMENIADSAAIKIAFQAYRERSRKQGFSSIEDDEDFFAYFAS